MTKAEVIDQALRLSERDRLAVAEEIWASVEDPNGHTGVELPTWQRELLDRRLEESRDEVGKPWDQVKAEIWPQSR